MATLTGNSTSQILTGTTSSDILYGAGGNDTLKGGLGDDTYKYYLGTGNDVIIDTSGSDTLVLDDPNGLFSSWNFTRSGTDLIVDFGSAGKVTIKDEYTGSSLVIDKLAVPDDNGGTYTLNLITSLTGSSSDEIIVGSSLANTIKGNGGDDEIFAAAGNDNINAGTGEDYIYGGLGSDTINGGSTSNDEWDESSYIIDSKGIIANLSETSITTNGITLTSNQVYQYQDGAKDSLSNIDGIEGSNYSDSFYASSNTSQWFGGQNGNDTFYGASNSTSWHGYEGGIGNDTVTYIRSISAVSIDLNKSAQTISQYYTDDFDSIENVTGSIYSDKLFGNTTANNINGASGNDSLVGGAGNDTLIGGAGNDALNGGIGTDTVDYSSSSTGVTVNLSSTSAQNTVGAGTDIITYVENITGSIYSDKLTGNSVSNTINSGAGNDILTGGASQDFLTGGSGSDTFNFDSISELTISGTTTDYIQDFVHGMDKIDLFGIDANTATTADNAFSSLIASTASFTSAGQLKYVGGILYGNTDSDSTAEFAIHLTGTPTVTISDFVL